MIETLDDLRASPELEIFHASEADQSVISEIVSVQREELEEEIAGCGGGAGGGGSAGAFGRGAVLTKEPVRMREDQPCPRSSASFDRPTFPPASISFMSFEIPSRPLFD